VRGRVDSEPEAGDSMLREKRERKENCVNLLERAKCIKRVLPVLIECENRLKRREDSTLKI
jgi:hypothetical protein